MEFFVLAGVVSAVAIIFLLLKLDIRKVLGYDVFVDITVSLSLMVLFFGTFAGMMAAVIGGAIVSVVLYLLKRTIGYKRLVRERFRLRWREFRPNSA